MKLIEVKKKRSSGSGAFGKYFIYNKEKKIGLKISHEIFDIDHCDFKEDVRICKFELRERSNPYWESGSKILSFIKEATMMKMLRGCKNSPKFYKLVWVKLGDKKYSIGIMMEHIQGRIIGNRLNKYKLLEEAKKEFSANKITNRIFIEDWHSHNVIIEKGGRKVRIDFGDGFFEIDEDEKIDKFWKIADNLFIEIMATLPKRT